MRVLPVPAVTLLRRLATHDEAEVTMRRVYPLEPRYRVKYVAEKKERGLHWADDPTDETILADLAMAHCVTLMTDKREGEEDVRVWRINERGKAALVTGGRLEDAAPEPPSLFAPEIGRRQHGVEHYG